MKGFPDLPPIWFAAALGMIIAISWALPEFSIQFPLQSALGWTCLGAGLGLIFWAAFWFFRKGTTIEPHHQATELLVEGPFRISRNPIYLGLGIILLGSIIGRGAWLAIPVLFAFVLVIHKRFVLPEEQGLRDVFGVDAEKYITKTRRWL